MKEFERKWFENRKMKNNNMLDGIDSEYGNSKLHKQHTQKNADDNFIIFGLNSKDYKTTEEFQKGFNTKLNVAIEHRKKLEITNLNRRVWELEVVMKKTLKRKQL